MAQVLPFPSDRGGEPRPSRDANRVVEPMHSPYQMYLDGLAGSTRSAAVYRVRKCASILWPGTTPETAPWETVDAGLLSALKARLEELHRFDYVNNCLSGVKGIVRACWALGLISTDQRERTLAVKAVKGVALPAGHYVEDDGWSVLFAATARRGNTAAVRDLAMLALLRGSGCRRHELVALDVDDLDLRQLTVKFRTAKGNAQRESALPEWARAPITAWMRARGPVPGALFFRMRGNAIGFGERLTSSGLHRVFKARCKEAGMPELTTHDTRRGFITTSLQSGIDVLAVGRQVGHRQPATTARYDMRPLQEIQQMVQRIPSPFQAREDDLPKQREGESLREYRQRVWADEKYAREYDRPGQRAWVPDESDVEGDESDD